MEVGPLFIVGIGNMKWTQDEKLLLTSEVAGGYDALGKRKKKLGGLWRTAGCTARERAGEHLMHEQNRLSGHK